METAAARNVLTVVNCQDDVLWLLWLVRFPYEICVDATGKVGGRVNIHVGRC